MIPRDLETKMFNYSYYYYYYYYYYLAQACVDTILQHCPYSVIHTIRSELLEGKSSGAMKSGVS